MNSIERESLFFIFNSRKKNKLHQATHDVPILTFLPILFAEIYACTGIILMGVSLLFFQIGWASFVAVGLIFLVSPVAAKLGSLMEGLSDGLSQSRSERVNYLQGLYSAFPILKAFNDEKHYMEGLERVRQKEEAAKKSIILSVLIPKLIFYFSSSFVYLATFVVYLWLGGQLKLETVFSCFLILKIIDFPISSISELTVSFAQSRASFKRISQVDDPTGLDLINLQISDDKITLFGEKEIQLSRLKPTTVIGPMGSGKSFFADQIFESLQNRLRVHLVNQTPYILNASLRENICMGSDITESRFQEILQIAHITSREFGENPADRPITDNGSNISGGQKQRIAIARALASDAEVLIFDDSLSSVDAKTRNQIFKNLTASESGKRFVIWITYSRLEALSGFPIIQVIERRVQQTDLAHRPASFLLDQVDVGENAFVDTQITAKPLMQKEMISENFAENEKYFWKSIWTYLKSFNSSKSIPWEFSLILLFSLLCLAAGNLQNNWLQIWATNQSDGSVLAGAFKTWIDYLQLDVHLNLKGLAIFSALAFLSFVLTTLRLVFWDLISLKASSRILKKAISGLFVFPVLADLKIDARDLNQRVNDDFTILDDRAQAGLEEAFSCLIAYLIAATTVFLFSMKFVFLYVVFFAVWIYLFRKFLVSNARLRKASIQKKGIWLGQLNSWGNFESPIKRSGAQNYVFEQMKKSLNQYQSAQLQINAVKRWFLGLSPVLGATLLLSILATILISSEFTKLAGLVVTFSVHQWMLLNVLARSLDEVQTYSLSMKRVFELDRKANSNVFADFTIPQNSFNIEINEASYGYESSVVKTSRMVLNQNEITVVFGATGAGKSTLIKGFIGMSRCFGGEILISGKPLATGQSLLAASCYVSQDPVFLRTSIKDELALVGLTDERDIQSQLEHVGLERYAKNLDISLEKLSLGEQQLLCALRAFNSQKKILIFDEVTSKLDGESEVKILNYIQSIKKDKVIILVSHRASTNQIAEQSIHVEEGFAKTVKSVS